VGDNNRILLDLPSHWMNQAGTLGYSPGLSNNPTGSVFVTNPISSHPRVPSAERTMLPFPGGFLLHTGLPNPGWKSIRRRFASHWVKSTSPVWVHLISQDLDELEGMVRDCEEIEGIAAIELGLPPDCPHDWMLQLIQSARGELPLVLHISLGEDMSLLRKLPENVAAVTLGSPRGALPAGSGKIIHGRLHGPGLFPQILEGLQKLRGLQVPLILGGICNAEDGKTALKCGAAAVQIDYFCWNGDLPVS
jgi:dihydroorotate dehydrogenase